MTFSIECNDTVCFIKTYMTSKTVPLSCLIKNWFYGKCTESWVEMLSVTKNLINMINVLNGLQMCFSKSKPDCEPYYNDEDGSVQEE